MKKEKLLVIPENITVAKVTKDGNKQEIAGDKLKQLREEIVNLEVREFGQETPEKNEGILVQFYEDDTECAWFRIIDEETLWDYSIVQERGIVVVYKTDADLMEMISKY